MHDLLDIFIPQIAAEAEQTAGTSPLPVGLSARMSSGSAKPRNTFRLRRRPSPSPCSPSGPASSLVTRALDGTRGCCGLVATVNLVFRFFSLPMQMGQVQCSCPSASCTQQPRIPVCRPNRQVPCKKSYRPERNKCSKEANGAACHRLTGTDWMPCWGLGAIDQ